MMQALIEVAGKLRFDMPACRYSPAWAGMILKPTLDWTIETDRRSRGCGAGIRLGRVQLDRDYNLVEGGSNALDVIGWVTMENRSGKEFENARVKLMAGDVNKIQTRANVMTRLEA